MTLSNAVGKHVVRPLSPHAIPVIADAAVEREFGTGALKITPGHDPPTTRSASATGSPQAVGRSVPTRASTDAVERRIRGLDRFEARKRAVSARCAIGGALVEDEPLHGEHRRRATGATTSIEPLLSLQWFVKMKPLAAAGAARVARPASCASCPSAIARTYERLAREHPRLVHLAPDLVGPPAAGLVLRERRIVDGGRRAAPQACADVRRQDELPTTRTRSTLGSPAAYGRSHPRLAGARRQNCAAWYPNQVLITAREIIFLWVARMVMFGHPLRRRRPVRDGADHAARAWTSKGAR